MDSIGQKLKKTRKLKNIKISDVSKELRISEEILKNFETDNIQDDINTVFLIGHLKLCFLRYLGFPFLFGKVLCLDGLRCYGWVFA